MCRVSALAAGKQRRKQKPKCRSLFLISYQNLSLKICPAVRNDCTRGGQSKRKRSMKVPDRALPEKLIVFSFCVRFHFVLLQFSFNIYASLIKLTPLDTGCFSYLPAYSHYFPPFACCIFHLFMATKCCATH